jgi:hypothetical protein
MSSRTPRDTSLMATWAMSFLEAPWKLLSALAGIPL